MGYYASGSGGFTFDMSKITKEQIEDILKGNECGCEIEQAEDGTGAKYSKVYVTLPYASYREDLWHDFLRSTNGLLKDGEIEFEGEDYEKWRFHYRNDEWHEDAGHTEYTEGFAI